MLSDRDALLRAIRAHPEEDTPRLMFADWLDEQGDEASRLRAEFVRLQCEIARLADDDSDSQPLYEFLRDRDFVTRPSADWTRIDDGIHRRLALTMRADDLLKRHGAGWVPKPPKGRKLTWDGFHRGFPHRIELTSFRNLGKIAADLRAAAPTVTLAAPALAPENVDQLAEAGLLGWISGLELDTDSGAGLRAFGHRPEAAGVRTVRVRYSGSAETVSALVDSPHWIGLRELDLIATVVSAETAEELFRAKHLRSLRRLHVHGNNWPVETVRTFASGGFSELASLRFSACDLDDAAAEVIAACPDLAKLRKLDLDHNNITGRGVTALLSSPQLARVAFLGLESNPGTGLDAERLAATQPAGLRMFHAHGCRFSTADVRSLARCPRLRTLWYLDLDANGLRTPAVRALIKGCGKWCPPILWMTHNHIDDRGAALLANWKAASALRVLHLKFNDRMTDAGALALLDSPNLADLDGLGVSTSSDELEARLKARFRYHEITYY
jgi:uncharacterized protein (TIGR02996 family)